jgi:hypothetical protein
MSTTAALVEGHYIATESTRRPNGVNVHQAGCQCGAQFEWDGRDKAHALHLLDVVRAEERERIARNIEAEANHEVAYTLGGNSAPTDAQQSRAGVIAWFGKAAARIAREGA